MSSNKKKKKTRKGKGTIWMLVGVLLILAAGALVLYNRKEDSDAYSASMKVLPTLREETEKEKKKGFASDKNPLREMPTITINGVKYIGELDIPALKLTLPVTSEWSYSNLKIAPCRYHGSVYSDDLVIAGHNYARHFSPIKDLPVGTDVYFTDVEGVEYHYRIIRTEVLQPEEIDRMIGPQEETTEEDLEKELERIENGEIIKYDEEEEEEYVDDWDLTLFTCTYGGQSRHTVRCKIVH